MPDNSKQTGPALEKTYQFVLWLLPTVEKSPRSHKFSLGDRIQSAALDALEGLVEATYTRNRKPILNRVNLLLDKLRLLFRLAMDLKVVDTSGVRSCFLLFHVPQTPGSYGFALAIIRR